MPPFTDIYVVTNDRSQACIDRFLARYADLTAQKERTDFSVLVEGEDVATGTLAATINYGLADKQNSFALYFNSVARELRSVILFFTPDGKLVLGLSTEYDETSEEEAKHVLAMLKTEYEASRGVIAVETPPGDAYDWMNENLRPS